MFDYVFYLKISFRKHYQMDLSLKILFILKNVWKYIKQEHYMFLKQSFVIKKH